MSHRVNEPDRDRVLTGQRTVECTPCYEQFVSLRDNCCRMSSLAESVVDYIRDKVNTRTSQ